MGKFKIYLLTLLILLLVIGSVGGILFLKNQKTIIEKLEEFESNSPQGIVIENNTFYPINNTMKIIVKDILKYENLTVIINELPQGINRNMDNKLRLRALIYPNLYYDHTYLILLAPDIQPENINGVLLHEAGHILQYESGDLTILNTRQNIYKYKNDTIIAAFVNYKDRQFEKDANLYEKVNGVILDSLLCK